MLVPVENHLDLLRDTNSKAVINKNRNALEKAKAAKQKRLDQQKQMDTLASEVKELKNTLQLILDKLS